MRGGMGQKYKLRKADVFGQCLMLSGNDSCFRAMPHVFGPYVFGQCLMLSGNVSCFRAMSHAFGQCLMLSGNASCFRAVCFRAMSHVFGPYVFGPYVFGQCLMLSGNVNLLNATSGLPTIWRLFCHVGSNIQYGCRKGDVEKKRARKNLLCASRSRKKN